MNRTIAKRFVSNVGWFNMDEQTITRALTSSDPRVGSVVILIANTHDPIQTALLIKDLMDLLDRPTVSHRHHHFNKPTTLVDKVKRFFKNLWR